MPRANFKDLHGYPPFTRLTVIERGPNTYDGNAQWWCACVCGTRVLVRSRSLLSGHTKSCGCLNDELSQARRTKHGLIHLPEYKGWIAMNQRCANPKAESYARYGGRGITVCDAWRTSFLTFYTDMGPRPGPGYTLERKSNDLGYTPDNCVWASRKTQQRNTRSNRLLTYDGITQCVSAWAEQLHISCDIIRGRLKLGWPIERVLTTPAELPRDKPTNRLLTYRGVTQCVAAWAEALHMSDTTLRHRLRKGWSDERALTTPIQYSSRWHTHLLAPKEVKK